MLIPSVYKYIFYFYLLTTGFGKSKLIVICLLENQHMNSTFHRYPTTNCCRKSCYIFSLKYLCRAIFGTPQPPYSPPTDCHKEELVVACLSCLVNFATFADNQNGIKKDCTFCPFIFRMFQHELLSYIPYGKKSSCAFVA